MSNVSNFGTQIKDFTQAVEVSTTDFGIMSQNDLTKKFAFAQLPISTAVQEALDNVPTSVDITNLGDRITSVQSYATALSASLRTDITSVSNLKVNRAGDTMTGNLVFTSGNVVIGSVASFGAGLTVGQGASGLGVIQVGLNPTAANNWVINNTTTQALNFSFGNTGASSVRLVVDGSAGGALRPSGIGTAPIPIYSFNGDPNTGMFSPGPDSLGFATGGTEAFRIESASSSVAFNGAVKLAIDPVVSLGAATKQYVDATANAVSVQARTDITSVKNLIPTTLTSLTGIVPGANGGTGVANTSKTITIGGNLTHAGAFTQSFTATGNTAVTLPLTGTLATLAGVETFTNKTLTTPVISTITNTGTLTLPTTTDTLVGRATTDTLTNKTLTSPTITGATITTSSVNGVTLTTGGSTGNYLGADGTYHVLTGGGSVTSVTSPNGTITVATGTTTPAIDIDLTHANSWSGVQTFTDTAFKLTDDVDPTKTAQFQLSPITTGTAVVYSMPAGAATAITLATTSTVTQTFTGTSTFSGTFTTNGVTSTLGTGTGGLTANVAVGATISGNTKTANVGTGGSSGSTTNINIGSATSGALGTLTVNSPNITFTSLTNGLVKSTSGVISNATAGTDYQAPITLTTTGTSGAATFTSNTLNIPQYTGGVSSVSNADGTLTISPTTGAVVASLNLGHANTWSGAQTFTATTFTVGSSTSAAQYTFGDGATSSGNIKDIFIGQNGAAGSTTRIFMGASTGGQVDIASPTVSISGPTAVVIGTGSGTATYTFGTGSTTSGFTKSVSLGSGGSSGSTTNITIGSTVSGSLGTTTIGSPNVTFSGLTSDGFVTTSGGTGALSVTTLGTGVAAFLSTPSSANLASAVTGETGSGALVFANSPTLVSPSLGTPSALILANATGLPIFAGTTGTLPESRGGTNQATYTTGDILYASAANTLSKLPIGGNSMSLAVSSSGIPFWRGYGRAVPDYKATYQFAANTGGGSGSATLATYIFNTPEINNLGLTLTSGVIGGLTVGAFYYAEWYTMVSGGTMKTVLVDSTSSATIINSAFSNVGVVNNNLVFGSGYFQTTSAGIKLLYINNSTAVNRLGIPVNLSSQPEVYGQISLWQVV